MAQGLMQFVVGQEEDWGEVPQALGMSLEPGGALLRGAWGEQVLLRGRHASRRVHHVQRDVKHVHYFTELYAILDPPLRLGLRADELSLADRATSAVLGAADLHVGHVELDRLFRIRANEQETARALLHELAPELVGAAGGAGKLWISDRHVTIEHEGYVRDVELVRAALSTVGHLATRLLALRAAHPTSWEPALASAWQTIADAWELSHDPRRACMEGAVRGTAVTLRLSDDGASTLLAMKLATPLGCSIALSRQEGSGFFAELFRGQDVTTGDPTFDAAWVVRGEPEARVREVLGPRARAALSSLLPQLDGLEIGNEGFEIAARARVSDPHALQAMLARAFAVAEALAPATPHAPFRS